MGGYICMPDIGPHLYAATFLAAPGPHSWRRGTTLPGSAAYSHHWLHQNAVYPCERLYAVRHRPRVRPSHLVRKGDNP